MMNRETNTYWKEMTCKTIKRNMKDNLRKEVEFKKNSINLITNSLKRLRNSITKLMMLTKKKFSI